MLKNNCKFKKTILCYKNYYYIFLTLYTCYKLLAIIVISLNFVYVWVPISLNRNDPEMKKKGNEIGNIEFILNGFFNSSEWHKAIFF